MVDDSGNAILNLGKSGKSSTKELNALLEIQREFSNYEISKKLPDIWAGTFIELSNASNKLSNDISAINMSENSLSQLNEINQLIEGFDSKTAIITIDAKTKSGRDYAEIIETSLKELGVYNTPTERQFRPDENGQFTIHTFNLQSLSNEQLTELKEKVSPQTKDWEFDTKDLIQHALLDQKDTANNFDLIWKDFLPSLSASINTSANFQNLSEEGQELVQGLVNSMDMSNEVLDLIKSDYNNIEQYVRSTILYPIVRATPEVQSAYNKLFSIDRNNLDVENLGEIDKQIDIIANYLNQDAQKLKVALGFDNKNKAIELFKPKSIAETINNLDEISKKLASINQASEEFSEKGLEGIKNTSLQDIISSFSDIDGVDLDSFLSMLTNTASTADEIKLAFDNLANQYIFNSDILEGLNDSNAEQIAKELELQGVANASSVIMTYLAAQKQYVAYAGEDLVNATYKDIAAFVEESYAAAETKQFLSQLELAKFAVNSVQINTASDIEQVIALAKAAGTSVVYR